MLLPLFNLITRIFPSSITATGMAAVFGVLMAIGVNAYAQTNNAPVDFSADAVTTNSETGAMTATGNVVLTQETMKLIADRVDYDRNSGKAVAMGNVIFTDHDGNTHYTEMLTLETNFSKAFAEPLISQFADGSWISGEKADHDRQAGTIFDGTRYTPCDCDFRNGATPAWELNASSSKHDPITQTVYHRNVTMKVYTVPVMYFPYLEHPDWTVRRRSGLLTPRVSFSSDLGATYSQPFYWVTGETHDVEITPYFFGNAGTGLTTTYRQRWDDSSLNTTIYAGRLNSFKKTREHVGGIDSNFSTTLGEKWKTNLRLYRASQDTFMRRYHFDSAETLKTSFLTERIDQDQYSRIEAYDIQDLKSTRNADNEPTVLPSVFHERYLDTADDDLKIRLRLSAIQLDNDESTDIKRWSSELYGRKDIDTGYGIFSTEGRLSMQYRNIETATNNSGYTGELGQGTAAIGLGWSKPVSIQALGRAAIIEPKLKLVSVKSTDRTSKIPNRDSADFRLDEANLFLLHREQGEDYNITSTRVDGGVSMSLYDPLLGDVTGFVGSSMRLAGDTPTGMNAVADRDRFSDILANLTIQPEDYYSLSMSGRFHPRDLNLNETIMSGQLTLGRTKFSGSYNQLSKSYFNTANQEKEELTLTASHTFASKWRLGLTQKYDLTNDNRKLTDSIIDVNYGGGVQDCLNISIGYNRDTDSDRDIKPIDEVFVVFTFKNLGSIGTNTINDISSD